MQDAPDRETLLANVAMFLMAQVEPALKAHPGGRGLAFRTRIAAHLIMTVGRELACEGEHDAAELARLRGLLGEPPGDSASGPVGAERQAEIVALRTRLAGVLRDDAQPIDAGAVRAGLMQTLREQLQVIQPRFDTRMTFDGDDAIPSDGTHAMPSHAAQEPS